MRDSRGFVKRQSRSGGSAWRLSLKRHAEKWSAPARAPRGQASGARPVNGGDWPDARRSALPGAPHPHGAEPVRDRRDMMEGQAPSRQAEPGLAAADQPSCVAGRFAGFGGLRQGQALRQESRVSCCGFADSVGRNCVFSEQTEKGERNAGCAGSAEFPFCS